MPELLLEGISKKYGRVEAVKNVDLTVENGKIVSILGPSGCGKTTTLRIIAGLAMPDSGRILLGGKDITYLPPEKRNMGMVFQNYAVWPHMNVFENVAFPLRSKKMSKEEIDRRVKEALEMVRMYELRERYPHQLSGGQQQRVALARALAVYPEVVLLDEPLSNLDARLREEMRIEIRELQRKLKFTAVYVTHDQLEAFTISDKIAVMNAGRIVQVAEPKELYFNPSNEFVANFLGKLNIIEGDVEEILGDNTIIVRTPVGRIKAKSGHRLSGNLKGKVLIGIRPSSFRVLPKEIVSSENNVIAGVVVSSIFLGEMYEYRVEINGGKILTVTSSEELKEGDVIYLEFSPEKVQVLKQGT
ncbi:MAG: ABC transporter ATP-binding protein [Fervidicoccaceae archaeon]